MWGNDILFTFVGDRGSTIDFLFDGDLGEWAEEFLLARGVSLGQ